MMMTAVASSSSDSHVTGSTALPVLSLVSHEVRSCPHTPAVYYSALHLWGVYKELIMSTYGVIYFLFWNTALNAIHTFSAEGYGVFYWDQKQSQHLNLLFKMLEVCLFMMIKYHSYDRCPNYTLLLFYKSWLSLWIQASFILK